MKRLRNVIIVILGMSFLVLMGCGKEEETTSVDTDETAEAETEAEDQESSTLDKIKEKGVLVVGSSNDAPFSYIHHETDEYTGIDGEIIKEIAKRLGIERVEMKVIKWESLLVELNNKNIDMVADGMYINPERQEVANFTDVWYQDGDALIVPNDSPIAGIDDLSDKVVGAVKGTVFLDYLEDLKDEGKIKDLIIFGSQAEGLLALNTQKMDAFVTDGAVAAFTIKEDSSLNLKIVDTYEAKFNGQIAATVRQEDTELLDAINTELNKLKEEDFILKVLEDHDLSENNVAP